MIIDKNSLDNLSISTIVPELITLFYTFEKYYLFVLSKIDMF